MNTLKLGLSGLSDIDSNSKVKLIGTLVIEEASELTYLMEESRELKDEVSEIVGEKVIIHSPLLLDKIFDELSPLVGGIFAYVVEAKIVGILKESTVQPFNYALENISNIELITSSGKTYQFSF